MTFPQFRQYLNLLWEMTRCEWRMREQSTMLGLLWALLYPILFFLIVYSVFTQWEVGHNRNYASLLIIGIVQYNFFSVATNYASNSLIRRRSLLFNFVLPREILVFSTVLSVVRSYLIEFALMLAFALILGAHFNKAWIFLPVIMAPYIVLVAGLSLVLAVGCARFPDLERIWSIATMAAFFLTPVFYTLDAVDKRRRKILLWNPLTRIIEWTRSCVLDGNIPSAIHLAEFFLVAALVIALSYVFFKWEELRLSDYLL